MKRSTPWHLIPYHILRGAADIFYHKTIARESWEWGQDAHYSSIMNEVLQAVFSWQGGDEFSEGTDNLDIAIAGLIRLKFFEANQELYGSFDDRISMDAAMCGTDLGLCETQEARDDLKRSNTEMLAELQGQQTSIQQALGELLDKSWSESVQSAVYHLTKHKRYVDERLAALQPVVQAAAQTPEETAPLWNPEREGMAMQQFRELHPFDASPANRPQEKWVDVTADLKGNLHANSFKEGPRAHALYIICERVNRLADWIDEMHNPEAEQAYKEWLIEFVKVLEICLGISPQDLMRASGGDGEVRNIIDLLSEANCQNMQTFAKLWLITDDLTQGNRREDWATLAQASVIEVAPSSSAGQRIRDGYDDAMGLGHPDLAILSVPMYLGCTDASEETGVMFCCGRLLGLLQRRAKGSYLTHGEQVYLAEIVHMSAGVTWVDAMNQLSQKIQNSIGLGQQPEGEV